MEVLVLDGKSYVKASKAAKDLGYATDYVGQLCRSGQVDAHLIGRTWYVNPDNLGTHRVEKKRMSRVKARAQAKKAIEERRLKVTEEPKSYKNIDIRYEEDSKELIPETRKIEVKSESTRIVKEKPEYDSETVIENKGNKVRMSGDLKVVDVTDAPVETDIVTLTPGRIRSGTITVTPRESAPEEVPVAINEEKVEAPEDAPVARMSFSERLEALSGEEGSTEPADLVEEHQATAEETFPAHSEKSSALPYVLITVLILAIVLATVPLIQVIEYSSDSKSILISYTFSFEKIISYIQLKI